MPPPPQWVSSGGGGVQPMGMCLSDKIIISQGVKEQFNPLGRLHEKPTKAGYVALSQRCRPKNKQTQQNMLHSTLTTFQQLIAHADGLE